jgi:hypothetical protein
VADLWGLLSENPFLGGLAASLVAVIVVAVFRWVLLRGEERLNLRRLGVLTTIPPLPPELTEARIAHLKSLIYWSLGIILATPLVYGGLAVLVDDLFRWRVPDLVGYVVLGVPLLGSMLVLYLAVFRLQPYWLREDVKEQVERAIRRFD